MARKRKPFSIRHEGGQSLVIVVLAMVVIIGIAAYAIDVSSWYSARHQAQVTADAAALAAANCLAVPGNGPSPQCSSPGPDTSDATTVATGYGQNGVTVSPSNVAINTTKDTVTVTANVTAGSSFARSFGIGTRNITATAVASWSDMTNISFSCNQTTGGSNCISLFAGNANCSSATPSDADPIGLDLLSNGGGHGTVTDAYVNGLLDNNNNSAAGGLGVTGVPCSSDNYETKNTTFTTMPAPIPYPAVWSQPTCTYSATYWTTAAVTGHTIAGPGVYCATGSPTTCADDSASAGDIYVDESKLTGAGYEFVGPCVSLTGASSALISRDNHSCTGRRISSRPRRQRPFQPAQSTTAPTA